MRVSARRMLASYMRSSLSTSTSADAACCTFSQTTVIILGRTGNAETSKRASTREHQSPTHLTHSPDLRITGGVVLRSASMVHRRHDKVSVWPSALIATLCVQKPASTGYAMVMQVSKWPVRHTTQHVPPHNHSHTIHIAFNNSVIALGDARGWCIIG